MKITFIGIYKYEGIFIGMKAYNISHKTFPTVQDIGYSILRVKLTIYSNVHTLRMLHMNLKHRQA